MDGESRRKVIDQHQEEPDDEAMTVATRVADRFTAEGRAVLREYLLSIPADARLKVGRYVLRTMLIELEELPETLVEE